MFMGVLFVSLLHGIPTVLSSLLHTCIPNTQFHVNGRLCICDAIGRWSEASCESGRRQICKPGQIIWEDCSQCICQENGHMICTNTVCTDDTISKQSLGRSLDMNRLWCIPFMSYYVNCSLCVCPVSGKMNEARCATDAACPFIGITDYVKAIRNNVCIPKVMYLFPCLHCLCSDNGFFIVNKCVETCQKAVPDVARRCVPRTFYRRDCNVCFCPDNGITNDRLCTKTICSHKFALESLNTLRNKTRRCQRQTFTGRKCFYCECTLEGKVDENSCLDSECLSVHNFEDNFLKSSCSVGEMVPRCVECLCLRNDVTMGDYCTKECRDELKLVVLETAIKDSLKSNLVLDRKAIKKAETGEVCEPNTIYVEDSRYCLCPDAGSIHVNLCTAPMEDRYVEKTKIKIRGSAVVDIDFNIKCDPNTFVEFDCNTCYCLKNGRIDPKWCTYDDCESKRIVMEKQKNESPDTVLTNNGACIPGSITKEDCNFCICPDSGQLKDKACTKNKCTGLGKKLTNILACEPLTYYIVDCNVCYCPKNGYKNVAKCTKNTCEKTFLRSEVCVPGRLFSEECNVCVCPPNGDKADRVCTNNTCNASETPWKKIFQLSQSLMSYQKMGETTRNLELCFPGEEFEIGCKICMCPDMGLRMYAACTETLCVEEKSKEFLSDSETPAPRIKRSPNDCLDADDDQDPVRKCTPGSMYIIKCEECICPYIGNINHFCRPLSDSIYCEQAFPGVNFLPSRRGSDDSNNSANSSLTKNPDLTIITGQTTPKDPNSSLAPTSRHMIGPSSRSGTTNFPDVTNVPGPKNIPDAKTVATQSSRTPYACTTPGRLRDDCFICDCDEGIIIQEHCFKNKHADCVNSTKPAFLKDIKLPERYL